MDDWGKYTFKDWKLPHYLIKDGFTALVKGFVRLKGNKLILPFSNRFKKTHKRLEITIPPILLDKKVKEIRIIPKAKAILDAMPDDCFFEKRMVEIKLLISIDIWKDR